MTEYMRILVAIWILCLAACRAGDPVEPVHVERFEFGGDIENSLVNVDRAFSADGWSVQYGIAPPHQGREIFTLRMTRRTEKIVILQDVEPGFVQVRYYNQPVAGFENTTIKIEEAFEASQTAYTER